MGRDRRGRVDAEPRYCSNCGDDLEPSMNYCPNCGTRIGRRGRSGSRTTDRSRRGDAESRARVRRTGTESRTTSRTGSRADSGSLTNGKRLETKIAKARSEGWRLEHDFGGHVVMVRRSFGDADVHLVIALATIWWTMGLANVLYGVYTYVEDAERMVLRPELTEDSAADETASESHLLARATAATCWLAGAILAAVGVQLLGSGAGVALVVLFGLLGLGVLPSVAERLERRHSVTTTGRTRSVEERSVVSHDQPCTACAEPVGRGVERIYRSEFCLLGLPLTGTEGRNYYCRRCANAERSPAARDEFDRSNPNDAPARTDAAARESASERPTKTDADAADELEPEPDSAGLD